MAETKKLHIAMFPWLAFGHIIPFYELSKLIASKGHRISFICTPRNIQRLPNLPPNLAPLTQFVSLPLPYESNLPENAEATMDVPYNKVQYLKRAYDRLQQPLSEFLEASRPDWIIYDFTPHWLPPVASKLGISRAFFSLFNAWSMSFFSSSVPEVTGILDTRSKPDDFTVPPKWISFPSKVAFRLYEVKKIFDLMEENQSGVSDHNRYFSSVSSSDVVVMRSSLEVEAEYLNIFHELHRKPVIPVGLLPPSIQISRDERDDSKVSELLDKREKGSVVYVALGTEAVPSQDELRELALGLEQSGLPFFWALRSKNVENGEPLSLPEGFEERTKERGTVWRSWAPQLRILSHESVGGFLTHCGWNSVIEGLQFGLPLIMIPFVGDQGLNARVLEDKKVGIEIPRNEEDGSFTRNSVAETLRMVMVSKGNNNYKEEAKKMSVIYGDKDLHNQYVDKFVTYLQDHTN